MVTPIMSNKDKENKENNANMGMTPTVTTSNVSDNISRNRDDDDDFTDTVKDVTLGDFNKFVKIQDTLERSIERRNERHAPIASFGEKLGMKIEERVSDTFIDKMLGNMFSVGGTSATKTDGWVSILKTVLDSGFAQQAGAKLPETIEALSKTIGKQKTDQLADGIIQAVNPTAKTASVEDEQKKMERFVMGLSPVNVIDIKKFMELVNANPANGKITDINQAREILKQEQERIRRENPVLANEIAIENQDKDTGMRSFGQPISPYGNSIDRMPGDMMNNMMPRDPGMMQNNQLSTEQILSLDPDNDMSVESYAWSMGYGNMLSEPNGSSKVRKLLMIQQDELTKQLSGLGGSIGEVGKEVEQGQEQPVETELVQGDFGWNENDVGKKGVGKGRRIGDEGIVIPPGVAKADSPVNDKSEGTVDQTQAAQASIMELLQKMALNFDSNMSEINQKLQAVENRVAKVESVSNVVPTSNITISEDNVRTVMETELEEDDNVGEDITEDDNVEEIIQETVSDIIEEEVKEEMTPEIIQEAETVSETKEEVKEDKTVKDDEYSGVHNKAPTSVLDKPKETKEDKIKVYPKGSQGWLREQKMKKAIKDNS